MESYNDNDLLIVGAGGHSKVVLEIVRAQGKYNPVAFLDADNALAGVTIAGLPVLGHLNLLPKLRQQRLTKAIIAIGDSRVRDGYAQKLLQAHFALVNAVHPSAHISPSSTMGHNVVIAVGAVIGTAAKVGDSVIINTAAVIDHECEIGHGAHICPGAKLAGRVRVGDGAFIGLGANVIQCLRIGAHAIIGAGAVVLEDVPGGATAVGVPARIIKRAAMAVAG